ncbi:MATE family efflux transporter [Citroniella saccharovorans]|uniref:Multidrug export protein MepA n=1 Tax=Citroniella saccharovorans TaxID=2053367 RepID=A0AAW9MSI0_9FIRM|nr:MATE family efflux transporter [Citroniella saccharovorans]MEB3430129.1 MATE family efflux transporter [Citroniella saccharovorans]
MDFSKGSIFKNILKTAIPLTIAQLVQLLYNIVDRVFIGHMQNGGAALTGIGLMFPIVTITIAFTNFYQVGGSSLFAIERGKKNDEYSREILNNTFFLLLISGIILTIFFYVFKKNILYLFGASENTFYYANEYLKIYLIGTVFSMLATGINSFIIAMGYSNRAMQTVLVGAILNIILDPIFIYAFNLGVSGAALATIISQFISFIWVMIFITDTHHEVNLNFKKIRIRLKTILKIMEVGISGFLMSLTNSLVLITCNKMLSIYGGDAYIGIMTIISSIRELFVLPINGIIGGAQPVMGYNYGAGEYKRVKKAIKIVTILTTSFTTIVWILLLKNPTFFVGILTSNEEIIELSKTYLIIYFSAFFMMSFQFSGQSTFLSLGMSKEAVFFTILRKGILVFSLTLLLPGVFGFGVKGVFLAEPISNIIGGAAAYTAMIFKVYRKL